MEAKMQSLFRSTFAIILMFAIICTVFMVSCGEREVELDTALQEIVNYKFGDNREKLTKVTDLVMASYGYPSVRLLLEKQFAQILSSDATFLCKDFICRQLYIVGTDVSVPVLANMLTDEKTSDMARYALENNPSSMAGKAFRDALKIAKGNALIGIVNSLGKRRDSTSLDALKNLSTSSDKEVSEAAAAALKKIGN